MGILYEIFKRTKKRCELCGCILEPDSEFDICECCMDDMNDGKEKYYDN